MRAGIRASLSLTGEDLGLGLRRALAGGIARRIDLQIVQRAGGISPDGARTARRRADRPDAKAGHDTTRDEEKP